MIAIERDARCLPALEEIAARYPGRLEVLAGDALNIVPARLPRQDGPLKIVANLPYNVGTQLLVQWLLAEPWPPFYESLTLMFQREVAERIVAASRHRRLWPPRRSRRLADGGPHHVRRAAAGLHAAAQGHLLGRPPGAARTADRLPRPAALSG